jgi:hypothetical protein
MEAITPVIDPKILQEKANEAAMQGAIKEIENFYTGFNSPYRESIKSELEAKGLKYNMELPDIIGILNERLTQEIDKIANTAIAESFVPMVSSFLTRADPEMKFSEVLKVLIDETRFDHDDHDQSDYRVSVKREDKYFLYLTINMPGKEYEVGFSSVGEERHAPNKRAWKVMTLPRSGSVRYPESTMKLSLEGGANLEIPFTRGVLEDDVIRFFARILLAKTKIYFDVEDFEEDFFPEKECYC